MLRECPNCGKPVAEGATMCAHCGAATPPLPEVGGPAAPPGRLMTKLPWLDVTLGVLTTIAATMLFGVGFLLALVVYYAVRGSYPVYARGVGIGMALVGILFLGTFAVCLVGLSTLSGPH